MKTGTDRVDVRSLRSANSVSVAEYGSASRMPKSGHMMSMQRLDLPEPCVPQTKSVGKLPTAFMKLAFIGVAKNQPRIGRMTAGVFTCGRYRNTVLAISRKVSSSVGT